MQPLSLLFCYSVVSLLFCSLIPKISNFLSIRVYCACYKLCSAIQVKICVLTFRTILENSVGGPSPTVMRSPAGIRDESVAELVTGKPALNEVPSSSGTVNVQ